MRTALSIFLLLIMNTGAAEQLYVNAQLALSKPSSFGSGVEALVAAGMPVPEHRNIFLEAELTSTLITPQRDSSEISYSSLGGYGIYRKMMDEQLAIHGKVGMLYQYSTPEQDDIRRGMGIALGIGATIRHNRAVSYLIEGVAVQGTLDLFRLSAGVSYRFR